MAFYDEHKKVSRKEKVERAMMRGGFDEFRMEHIRTTAPCRDHAALKQATANFDVLVCGSDQIWSPVWLNPAYFLDFTDKPKVSYAPSLGVKDMPKPAKQRKITRLVMLVVRLMTLAWALEVRISSFAKTVKAMMRKVPVPGP